MSSCTACSHVPLYAHVVRSIINSHSPLPNQRISISATPTPSIHFSPVYQMASNIINNGYGNNNDNGNNHGCENTDNMNKPEWPRKKRIHLTMKSKQEMCQQKQANPTITINQLSEEYSCDRSTVSKVLKSKNE